MTNNPAKTSTLSLAATLLILCVSCTSTDTPNTLQPLPHPNLALLDEAAEFPVSRQQTLEAQTGTKQGIEASTVWGELGMLYQAYHLYQPALVCYQNARFLDSRDPRWIYLIGVTHQRLGNQEQAIKAFSAAIMADPQNTAALVTLGELEFLANNPQRAGELFEQAYRLNSNTASALVGMGKVARQKKQYQKAAEFFTKALELEPEANITHYLLALAYRDLGKLELAQQHMAQRGEIQPVLEDPILMEVQNQRNDSESLRTRGNQIAATGQFAEALGYYRQALKLKPKDPRTWVNVGLCFQQLNQLDEAKEAYQNVLQNTTMPNLMATAHFRLGELSEDNLQQAFSHYQAALQANPSIPSIMFRYAENLRAMGRFEEALPYYSKVLPQKPDFYAARLGRALSLIKLGRWRQVLNYLKEDIQTCRDQPVFSHMLARLLAACPDDAVRNGEQALEMTAIMTGSSQNAEILATHAMVLAETGKYAEAAAAQRQAISLAVEQGQTVAHLQQNLLSYIKNRPCRIPWPEDAALFLRKNY